MTRTMNIRLYHDAYSSNPIELDFFLWIIPPISHFGHVNPSGVKMTLISLHNNGILIKLLQHLLRFSGIYRTVVVESTFYIFALIIQSMEPDIRHDYVFTV